MAYVVFMLAAWVLDRRECFTTLVPYWAEPGTLGFPLWRQWLYCARTQLSLLRPLHVVPGRTAYTHLQVSKSVSKQVSLSVSE